MPRKASRQPFARIRYNAKTGIYTLFYGNNSGVFTLVKVQAVTNSENWHSEKFVSINDRKYGLRLHEQGYDHRTPDRYIQDRINGFTSIGYHVTICNPLPLV